jgi:hypothetical protein
MMFATSGTIRYFALLRHSNRITSIPRTFLVGRQSIKECQDIGNGADPFRFSSAVLVPANFGDVSTFLKLL